MGSAVKSRMPEDKKEKNYLGENGISANSIHEAIYERQNSSPGPSESFTILSPITHFAQATVDPLLSFSSL